MKRALAVVALGAAASCAKGGPAGPSDPLALCLERTALGDASGAREVVEGTGEVRIAAGPLGEEGATAVFGVSTPAAASLWRVTIEVKSLPAGAHLLVEPPRFVRQCQETNARWEPMWPSTREAIFPPIPPLPRSGPHLLAVPPLYDVVEPPSVIKPGEAAQWDRLEQATGKARSRKHSYKLTSADVTAWSEAEEARRAAAQTAHDAAVRDNRQQASTFEQERARHDAAVEAAALAREGLGKLSSVTCDPPQSIGSGHIVFATPARCEYLSLPIVSAPPAGVACDAPVAFVADATWVLHAPGRSSCTVDASATFAMPEDATAADLTALFADGPLPLAKLRGPR